MTDTPESLTPAGWQAGAKALAAFQAKNYAAGKSGNAQGRSFSSLKDICKTIQGAAEFGLSHSETWRPLGIEAALLRVTLHHESGESIHSELPVDITQKNRSGSREQAQGSAMTYARRYLLLGIYGLANDDEDDDGEATVDRASSKPEAVALPKPQQTPVVVAPEVVSVAADQPLSDADRQSCVAVIKDPIKGHEYKAAFMAKFYPSASKLTPQMLCTQEHLLFLSEISSTPSAA